MFKLKNIIYAGIFLGSFAAVNTAVYFFLRTTQPKTLIGQTIHGVGQEAVGDSAVANVDSLALAEAEFGEMQPAHGEKTFDSSKHQPVASAAAAPEISAETAKTKQETPSHTEAPTDESRDLTGTPLDTVEPDNIAETEIAIDSEQAQEDQNKLAKLAKLLESMKPDEGAAIASQLEPDVIVQLMMKMKPRAAAKLLASLPVDQAAVVAEQMSQMAIRGQK